VPLFPVKRLSAARIDLSRPRRAGLAVAAGAFAVMVFAGCTPGAGTPTASPSSTAAPTGEPTTAPTETVTPTPTPTPAGTPLSLSCDQVLSPDDVYAFNPNFGTAPDYKPSGGSAAETAVSYDGVACGWLNQTSGEIIEVSVAQPNDILTPRLKDAAIEDSKPVPTYGTPPDVDGFFTNAAGAGEAQVFTRGYWVALSSVAFFEPGDAQQLVAAVVSHLP
jgi:hypothetical protein